MTEVEIAVAQALRVVERCIAASGYVASTLPEPLRVLHFIEPVELEVSLGGGS